jgi:ubiquinone/menaquinone biosynthesis C-methylase UbiE
MTETPNFNRIARAYRWLEYLTLGPLLERTRNHHLPRLTACRQALILGDGDGRFTAGLMAANPALKADAVDISRAMLDCLSARCAEADRLRLHHADARTFTPTKTPDLIVTHFFLDCLSQPEVDALTARLAGPGTLWLISDFRIPRGPLQWPARIYIRMLYLAFRVLTGLRVSRLPDHARPLRANGFVPVAIHHELFGILTTELWSSGD